MITNMQKPKSIKHNLSNVVIISAERFPSFGPISIASLLLNNNIPTSVLQCILGFSHSQIVSLVNQYIVDDQQIIGVSTTFSRDANAIDKIKLFLTIARFKFPNIKIIVGGANDDLNWTKEFDNIVIMSGQNKEQQIIDWFISNVFPNPDKIPLKLFSFTTSKIRWPRIFSSNPPKGFSGFLEMSRSCIFNCSFCGYQNRGKLLPYKDASIVKQELEEFYKIFKTSVMYITCNTFNDDVNKIRLLQSVFDELSFKPEIFAYTRLDLFSKQDDDIKLFFQKYVKFPFFGIESMNSATLKNIKKGNNITLLKNALIEFRKLVKDAFITSSLVIGLPNDTLKDYLEAIDFLKEYSDFLNISALRLKRFEAGNDPYSFSSMELRPVDFGYSILPIGKRTYSLTTDKLRELNIREKEFFNFPGWVRNDGYDFEQAIADTINIENSLEMPLSFGPHIFLRSRGLRYDDLISYRGKLSQHKIFIDYDVDGDQEHPCTREINYHTELFHKELFEYYMKNEQVRINELF